MILPLLHKPKFCLIVVFSVLLAACQASPDSSKPKFTSANKISVLENTTSVLTIEASDNSSVTFSITSGADKTKFLLSSNGILAFKSQPDFEKPSDSNKDNKYTLTIKATDSANNTALQTITVNVTDADEIKPVFTSNNTVTIKEGSTNVTTVKATDKNTIHYAINAGNDSDKFSIQKQSGRLSFKIPPSYKAPTDKDKNNLYLTNITATDNAGNSASMLLTVTVINTTIDLSSDITVSKLGKGIKLNAAVDLGASPKTLYVLFTNHDATNSSAPSITHNAPKLKILPKPSKQNKAIKKAVTPSNKLSHKPNFIRDFNAKSRVFLSKQGNKLKLKRLTPKRKQIAKTGETDTFYMGITDVNSDLNAIKATARKVITAETNFGPKTLSIWVSDSIFDSNNDQKCEKNKNANHIECVTQKMVNELADKFLKGNGTSNDTYDWVTNIYGEEWGAHHYSGLIEANNEISILLTDINNDNKLGGVIGYFYAKDNFLKSTLSGSNERIMFYLDAIMFASSSSNNFYKKSVYATLTHEFTHLIEYYQKDIKLLPSNKTSDTWLAEMVAESTEYLTSYAVKHDSPRGIIFNDGTAGDSFNTNDRYPDFNRYNNSLSLTSFDNTVQDYSKVSAFGTFLVNNYGGAQVLHDILHSSSTNEEAVVEAVNKAQATTNITFGEILTNWGVAVLLSDKIMNTQSVTPRYNTGGFTNLNHNGFVEANGVPSGNSTEYKIGSINFFNYSFCLKTKCSNKSEFQDGPTISTTVGKVMPYGNFFYKVGDKLTGIITIQINTDETIETTLIAK